MKAPDEAFNARVRIEGLYRSSDRRSKERSYFCIALKPRKETFDLNYELNAIG